MARARSKPSKAENPLERWVGTTQSLQVLRLNDDGDGVAKLNDITVFVPGALPGETVQGRIQVAHRRHLVAALLEAVVGEQQNGEGLNDDTLIRVAPLCPIFEACGGCQLQHVNYSAQLKHKQDVVSGALQRMCKGHQLEVLPTIGMDHPWRYRNQIQIPLRYNFSEGRFIQGFFAAGSHVITETESCLLVPEAVEQTMNQIPIRIAEVLGNEAHLVHHLILRHSTYTDEQMVILCVRQRPYRLSELAESLLSTTVVSVAVTVQPETTGPVWGDAVQVVAGQPTITERLQDVDFLISPRSFFQVNTVQANVLTLLAKERSHLTGGETVLDAYCGTGTFSLTLAGYAEGTVGVESVSAAIADARRNAEKNGITNAQFHVGNVEDVLPQWVKAGKRFDVVLLDPPRKGCHPDVLKALVEAEIPRIVYVSCNPSTLARDTNILLDAGYQAGSFQPVDMFPNTSHVECVVEFTK